MLPSIRHVPLATTREAEALEELDLEIVLLRHELTVLLRHVRRQPFRLSDRPYLEASTRSLLRVRWSSLFATGAAGREWHRRLVARDWMHGRPPERPPIGAKGRALIVPFSIRSLNAAVVHSVRRYGDEQDSRADLLQMGASQPAAARNCHPINSGTGTKGSPRQLDVRERQARATLSKSRRLGPGDAWSATAQSHRRATRISLGGGTLNGLSTGSASHSFRREVEWSRSGSGSVGDDRPHSAGLRPCRRCAFSQECSTVRHAVGCSQSLAMGT
jgi:hypothetical protein